ncbi:enterobactin synthase subunit EntD [Citrobacter freundii]|uniref:enterobactin synthase subunit EntD n=1 Tax=Citrobacter freundii TaxID=546 RepID=UPI001782606E|nr:enterobactin synthase subunit EntD [Citrobacter freundii]MBD9991399.1 enterobactin synthase subunit EntD [Citrobacter freundii]MBE0055310.1 enterobactin synthase subunit EntD [Citrobacter freundii]MDT7291350.1 enterobactin synthase subunit EntD [Citrobacter freundii]HBU6168672.1 enterobactin synthase subunit EntD [Citrobacter freundii]HBV8020805.1 enterobactin synthase subunit EntD [Citrobacter freundii]
MHTTHTPLTFADHTLHVVEFDPDSFNEHDLLWLPHHTQLQSCGRKRKTEHLAGRIAAVHALREYGIKTVPGIGGQRQPLWPHALFGSISHSATTALAVVSTHPVGLDIEAIFTPQTAVELADGIIDNCEQRLLQFSPVPFPLALTLAFSAKESVYKTFSAQTSELPGFASAKIVALTATHLTVQITPSFSQSLAGLSVNVSWFQREENIITLCEATL